MSTHIDSEDPPSPSVPIPLLLRLDEILISLRSEKLSEAQLKNGVSDLVEFLYSTSVSVVDEEGSEGIAFEILSRVYGFIQSMSEEHNLVDTISDELPKYVARFAPASNRCLEMAETIIVFLARNSNPRDMLSMLCEAFSSPGDMYTEPNYFASLLGGISQVFLLIQRRQFEQMKVAVPIILGVLKVMAIELRDEDMDLEVLFDKAICFADSIKAVCNKSEEKDNKLPSLLGLFVLQLMALATMGMRHKECLPMMMRLSHFLPYSGLSYIGLITGSDIGNFSDISKEDDGDDFASCFSHVQHGASLAVIWGYKSADIAKSAEADMEAVIKELRYNLGKRWLAVDKLKHIFSHVNIPWNLKQHAVDFLSSIMGRDSALTSIDGSVDFAMYTSLYSSLQALQTVIVFAPDAMLRKKAFAALKQVLVDIPTSMRFDILKALVKNSDSSSMIAVLLDIVREEMHSEISQITLRTSKLDKVMDPANGTFEVSCFWCADVLQFVEMVLRPPNGGPPSLPEFSDAVLSALNLYRYIFITELSGKTNYTGVLLKEHLIMAYHEWLLPLRSLVTGIEAENQKNCHQLASDIWCALNPVGSVLYRCIELVEENM